MRLAQLVLVAPPIDTPPGSPDRNGQGDGEVKEKFEIMLCATHFIGDGMALHTFMNEFYTLLGSDKSVGDLEDMIEDQLYVPPCRLPLGLEDRLPGPGQRLAGQGEEEAQGQRLKKAVGDAAYDCSERRLVGGQSFPLAGRGRQRRTVVPTFAYTPEQTKRILSKCKANGVTIAHAVFALCNIAWTRLTGSSEMPW